MSFLGKVDNFLSLKRADNVKNMDLVPIPVSVRRWTTYSYAAYWSIICVCLVTWSAAASLYDKGFTGTEIVGVVVVGNIFISTAAILNSMYGSHYHIGYSVFQRVVLGVRGSFFGVLLRSLLSVVWFASQAWLGGLCVTVVLSSLSKSFMTMNNTLSDSVDMTTQSLVSFIIFLALNFPILLIKPVRFDGLMAVGSILTFVACLSVCLWVVKLNGSAGHAWHHGTGASGTDSHAWMWVNAVNSWYSALVAGISNQADFSRFNKKPVNSYIGTIFGINVVGFLVPTLAVICQSAWYSMNKQSPSDLTPAGIVQALLIDNYDAKTRAAAFFLGLVMVYSQLIMCSIGNAIPGGMDLSLLFPKYINIRRGAIIVFFLTWVVQPWTFYTSGSTFVTVMSSFSVFVTPLVAIYMCEYFVIRKRIIRLTDCYNYGPDSIYWYTGGINFKALISFFVGSAPGIPGLVNAADSTLHVPIGFTHYFYGSFIFQFFTTFALYWAMTSIFPNKVGERDEYDYYDTFTEDERLKWNLSKPYSEGSSFELKREHDLKEVLP